MRIRNVHERLIAASPSTLGEILDTLSSTEDRLWPVERWPRVRLDRPLSVGAAGGHSFIRYHVTHYEPGRRVVFQFDPPLLIEGDHRFEVQAIDETHTILRHAIAGRVQGVMSWRWRLVVGPLHDALIEDAFDCAEYGALGSGARPARWSLQVRLLRAWTRWRARAR